MNLHWSDEAFLSLQDIHAYIARISQIEVLTVIHAARDMTK